MPNLQMIFAVIPLLPINETFAPPLLLNYYTLISNIEYSYPFFKCSHLVHLESWMPANYRSCCTTPLQLKLLTAQERESQFLLLESGIELTVSIRKRSLAQRSFDSSRRRTGVGVRDTRQRQAGHCD
jgi:hypothetical protein